MIALLLAAADSEVVHGLATILPTGAVIGVATFWWRSAGDAREASASVVSASQAMVDTLVAENDRVRARAKETEDRLEGRISGLLGRVSALETAVEKCHTAVEKCHRERDADRIEIARLRARLEN